jgi:prepilin signal peptidase PulO-like enzyme (type II secretory pathway)
MNFILFLNDYIAVITASWLGLCIGSFLNVVIIRLNPFIKHERLPKNLVGCSQCGNCSSPILKRDNIPLISWLLLKGKARCCGKPISIQYPMVEFITGIGFILIAWVFGNSLMTVLFWSLYSISICLIAWLYLKSK